MQRDSLNCQIWRQFLVRSETSINVGNNYVLQYYIDENLYYEHNNKLLYLRELNLYELIFKYGY